MAVSFKCLRCGHSLSTPDGSEGGQTICPDCKLDQEIPESAREQASRRSPLSTPSFLPPHKPTTIVLPVSDVNVIYNPSGRPDLVLPLDLLQLVCIRCGENGNNARVLHCTKQISFAFLMLLISCPLGIAMLLIGTLAGELRWMDFWAVATAGSGIWILVVARWVQFSRYWQKTRLTYYLCQSCCRSVDNFDRWKRRLYWMSMLTAALVVFSPALSIPLVLRGNPLPEIALIGWCLLCGLLFLMLVVLGIWSLRTARNRRFAARWLEEESALEIWCHNADIANAVVEGAEDSTTEPPS